MKTPYNPCQDGFFAKVWECLRRNEGFRAEFERNRNGAAEPVDGWYSPIGIMHPAWDSNMFASQVIVDPAGWDLDRPWNEIRSDLRERFHHAMREQLPFTFSSPAVSEWRRFESNRIELHGFMLDTKYRERDFVCIAVPRLILDQRSRRAVMEKLSELVPQAAFKSRYLDPGGRALGTAKQWEAFLLFEYWTAKGLSRTKARALVALKMHEPEEYRDDEGYLLSPTGMGIALTVDQARGASPVWERISAVKDAIKSVYPRFNPYCARR